MTHLDAPDCDGCGASNAASVDTGLCDVCSPTTHKCNGTAFCSLYPYCSKIDDGEY